MTSGKALLLSTALFLSALPVHGQAVDPKTHKLCSEAKDYAGCVRAMNGEAHAPQRVITQQGADIAEGNQCPSGFAYVGGGNCEGVKCSYNYAGFNSLGHDQLVAGKKDQNGEDIWKCDFSFWEGSGVLRLSGNVTRATINPQCPAGEPPLGYNNPCQVASGNGKTN
jgi:hypothetical protein